MRELTEREIDRVNGGWLNMFAGAVVGAASAYREGGNGSQIAASAVLGAASAAYLNFAGSAAAGGIILRASYGVRGIGYGITSSMVGSSGGGSGGYNVEYRPGSHIKKN